MSREDLLIFEGRIIEMKGGGVYIVKLEGGVEIPTKLGGRLKKRPKRLVPGDKVIVSLSPYDTSHGVITARKDG